jgi:hypothetical protein
MFCITYTRLFHKLLWFLEKPRNEMGYRDLSGLQKDRGNLETEGWTQKITSGSYLRKCHDREE